MTVKYFTMQKVKGKCIYLALFL